ncbi:MAG: hypothetical protein R6U32_03675 [Candidatus Woesearchaeota archaeon]
MAGKKGGAKKSKKKSRSSRKSSKKKEKEPKDADSEETEDTEDTLGHEEDLDDHEEDLSEGDSLKDDDEPEEKEAPERGNGLRIFLIFLVVIGLFIPASAYVQMDISSEQNVRDAVTSTAVGVCEMEAEEPAEDCARSQLSSTKFTEEYTYQDVINDATNLIYYGGGRVTDQLTKSQKNFVSICRMKNVQEYSFYGLFFIIFAVIGLISLLALYRRKELLGRSLLKIVNATLFLLFLFHTIMFIIWTGYVPRVLSTLARSSGESLRAMVFGADFGFAFAKLHLIVAAASLVLLVIIIIIRKALRR